MKSDIDVQQLNALIAAIKNYYAPSVDDDGYDDEVDEDPTFSFRVDGVWVDFGSVPNDYSGLYRLRAGGSYSDGPSYSGKTVKELASKILIGAQD
jgi:hypothetical protein